jgi:hypothetical protein
MRVLLPLYLPVAKTHTVYRTRGDLHAMLRHRHETIARVGCQMLSFLPAACAGRVVLCRGPRDPSAWWWRSGGYRGSRRFR